ncbi:unnamed protein product [Auanema sp. JU1783]|nr:unnamed protein product [Auanema sp. JU1783]
MRATRMSVVDFWKNETHGDGLNIRVAHGVNSWPDLVDQLHEPFLNKSMMIEGDVFLQSHRRPRHRAIPVMRANARMADRITFKEWLREVATLRKAIKINFRSTEVVRPVLQYLYASQADPTSPGLEYPVILHANVFRAPRSLEMPVDPSTFVEKTSKLFPDATLSLGWTKQTNYSSLEQKFKKITWHQLFDILEYIDKLDQPVMLSVRLSVAANSKYQLLWLLGIDQSVSLLIWSDSEDEVLHWNEIADLRRQATKNRVLYDLTPMHRAILENITTETIKTVPSFSLSDWHPVTFASSSSDMLSTVVRSDHGPAFLGHPSTILLSQLAPPSFPSQQIISGKVHFLMKRVSRHTHVEHKSGLVIYLMDKVHDIESPIIKNSLQVFIGYDGRVIIENSMKNHKKFYESKSVGQLPRAECYDFNVVDRGYSVVAELSTAHCRSHSARHRRHLRKEVTRIELDTPFKRDRPLRSVVISKTGDGAVDFLLEELHHSSISRISFIFILFLYILRLL